MNEFILGAIAAGQVPLTTPADAAAAAPALPPPTELTFDITPPLETAITEAAQRFDKLVGEHELHVLHYEGFGSKFAKAHGASPDAAAQLVKQLAWHKMHARPAVTYESAQTRRFARGRTEVIRAASSENKAWAEAMLAHPPRSSHELKALFDKAVVRHGRTAAAAASGQGVDRHLFGLKKLLAEGEKMPALYTDPAFAASSHWELSTSQLSSRFVDGWGYGEVVPDGYGLSYAIGDDYIRWTITSCGQEGAVLKHFLAESATEVKRMLEGAAREEKKAAAPKL